MLSAETTRAQFKQQPFKVATSSDSCRCNVSPSLSRRKTYPGFEGQRPKTRIETSPEGTHQYQAESSVVTNKDMAEARYATIRLLKPWFPLVDPEVCCIFSSISCRRVCHSNKESGSGVMYTRASLNFSSKAARNIGIRVESSYFESTVGYRNSSKNAWYERPD